MMMFLISFAVGLAAAGTRNLFSMALACLLLAAVCGGLLLLGSPLTAMDLLTVLLGFQVGLILCLLLHLAAADRRATPAPSETDP